MVPEPQSAPPRSAADAPASLVVAGPLLINSVAEWHQRLLGAVSVTAPAVIDVSGVTAADIFGVQLLVSAQRTAAQHGVPFALRGAGPALLSACTTAGINPTSLLAP